jgi:hypothetical protein
VNGQRRLFSSHRGCGTRGPSTSGRLPVRPYARFWPVGDAARLLRRQPLANQDLAVGWPPPSCRSSSRLRLSCLPARMPATRNSRQSNFEERRAGFRLNLAGSSRGPPQARSPSLRPGRPAGCRPGDVIRGGSRRVGVPAGAPPALRGQRALAHGCCGLAGFRTCSPVWRNQSM